MKDFLGACLLGALLGVMIGYGVPARAQSYQMNDGRGNNVGTVQINGNTAQFVNPMGVTTQTATMYPNQVILQTPNGVTTSVLGTTLYTVPLSPPTVPTVRVMQ
jgi:hypothetical protein